MNLDVDKDRIGLSNKIYSIYSIGKMADLYIIYKINKIRKKIGIQLWLDIPGGNL